MAIILDGKTIAEQWMIETKAKIYNWSQEHQRPIKFGIIQVGNNFASSIYVKKKLKMAQECGVIAEHLHLPETTSETELLTLISKLNTQAIYDGVLIQLPLPKNIDEQKVLALLDVGIDVDGFSFTAIAKMWTQKRFNPLEKVVACTPKGIIKLLQAYKISLAKKHVVVINRSNIVGKPLVALLLACDATVTVCHSQTVNIKDLCLTADIIITGVGVCNFIDASYVKPDAVVVDVAINYDANKKLCGDVKTHSLDGQCYAYSPVPKGVGPMTVAAIFDNLYLLVKQKKV